MLSCDKVYFSFHLILTVALRYYTPLSLPVRFAMGVT